MPIGISGQFGLFSRSPDPALAYMVYAMQIVIDGRVHWFNGRKHVRMAGPWKLWAATTTLDVTLHDGPMATHRWWARGFFGLARQR